MKVIEKLERLARTTHFTSTINELIHDEHLEKGYKMNNPTFIKKQFSSNKPYAYEVGVVKISV